MTTSFTVPHLEPQAAVPGAPWRTRLCVWSVPALLGVLYAQRLGASGEPEVPTWKLAVIALATWYAWVLFTPVVERFADRWPLRGMQFLPHASAHLLAAVCFAALQGVATSVGTAVVGAASFTAIPAIAAEWFLVLLPAGVVVYGAVVSFRQATVTRVRLEQQERQAERLMLALRGAQLATLRAQLQPHFLFNTLTAITALVRDGDTSRASTALDSLSVLLRSALRATDRHEEPLQEELHRLTQYIGIEELRLGRPLTLSLRIDRLAERALVPVWILQPLVENSVRHGLRAAPTSGMIEIEARVQDGVVAITVRDDGVGLSERWEEKATVGYGLSNCRARLAALHGDQARLELRSGTAGGACVTLSLPYRESTS